MNEETLVLYLLPLRLFTGWVFLMESLQKIASGWLDKGRLVPVIEGWLKEGKTYSFFAPILHLVMKIPTISSYFVVFSELLIGAALLAGLFTRLASLAGIALVLCFLLARGDGAGPNPTAPFVMILITLALTHTGRTLGLDAVLRDKVPRWLT